MKYIPPREDPKKKDKPLIKDYKRKGWKQYEPK
jgi:hypothetical protein